MSGLSMFFKTSSRILLAVFAAVLFAGNPASAQAPEDDLIGFYCYGTHFGPMVQGEIIIARADGAWWAAFAGLETKVDMKGKAVSAAFPQGIGRFRGTLAEDGRAIDGFWVRPAVTEVASSQPFSTPLVLRASGRDKWRGEVVPLKERFKLYLKIFRDEKGRLLGAFRDPNRNDIGGASRFLVAREGRRVTFSLPNDTGGYDLAFDAQLLQEPARLKVKWAPLHDEIEMRRVAAEDVPGFFPRPPGEPAYKVRKPEAMDDGWKTERGSKVGIDEAALARAVQKIIDGDPAGRTPSLVHSLLVARHGRLVLEEYFFGYEIGRASG